MRRTALWAALMCAITLVGPVPLHAQDVTGSIDGRVVDDSAAAIPQARIVVSGVSLPGTRTAASDEQGRFRILGLPVGAYSLEITALGHAPGRRDGILVTLGRSTFAGTIVLHTEAITVAGIEAVESAPAGLDLRSTTGGSNIAVSSFASLPVDRDYQSILAVLPQANASAFGDRVNLDGLTGAEAQYYLNGVRVVEPPGNSVSTSVPYNLLREIEVRGSGYEAEFGGSGGAIVNAVTVSGGDTFHGQVYGFLANRLLSTHDGTLRLPNSTSGYAAWDAGVAIGGPVRRNSLWYQLSYAPAVDTRQLDVAGLGELEDRRVMHRYAASLTWRPRTQSTLELSASGDPSQRDQVGGVVIGEGTTFGNADPLLGEQPRSSVNWSLRATQAFGARTLAEWTLYRSDFTYGLGPRTDRGRNEPLYIDARTGYVEGGFGTIIERDAGRTGTHASLAGERGEHSWKAGAGYEDEFASETTDINTIRRLADSAYTYTRLGARHTDNHIRVATGFAQDSWQATRWLRVNAGLRWSGEYWITSGGEIGQHITDQWQPRVGFVIHHGASARSRLYASVGRFSQQTRLNILQYFLQDVPDTFAIVAYNHDPRTDPSGGVIRFAQILGRQPEVHGLRGASFDEVQIGGEHVFTNGIRTGVRAVARRQHDGIVGVLSPVTGQAVYGNPGRGDLAAYPRIERHYRSLEWTMEREGRASFRASYMLSSSKGNYEGYWQQTAGDNDPLGAGSFVAVPAAATYLEGTLPNDRPHVAKLSGAVQAFSGFTVGTLVQFASGTPLSELGTTPFGPPYYVQLRERGSVGRSPWLYDLNLRLGWQSPRHVRGIAPRFLIDVYHIGNPRRVVFVDQVHYRGVVNGQPVVNLNYGEPLAFQPGAAIRFGLEADW